MVKGGHSRSEGRRFESQRHIQEDMKFFHNVVKIVLFA